MNFEWKKPPKTCTIWRFSGAYYLISCQNIFSEYYI